MGLKVRVEDSMAKVDGVEEHERDAEEESNEVDVVVPADAIVEPDAMMVGFCNAGFTNVTVFGTGGFGELTRSTELTGMEYDMIVWIVTE